MKIMHKVTFGPADIILSIERKREKWKGKCMEKRDKQGRGVLGRLGAQAGMEDSRGTHIHGVAGVGVRREGS